MLNILYQDNEIIAVNKPHGIAVHASKMYKDDKDFVLQMLRNQIEKKVFPAHRLDKKTSGVLLFSLTESMNKLLQTLFAEGKVDKTYHALVRGYVMNNGEIDYPLINNEGKKQEALTKYNFLQQFEIPLASANNTTSRYSLLELAPKTGRYHQLRKHLAHIFHPIIGDRPHGCNKQNKLWKEKFRHDTMMLHAKSIKFIHPISAKLVEIEAPYSAEFEKGLDIVGNEF